VTSCRLARWVAAASICSLPIPSIAAGQTIQVPEGHCVQNCRGAGDDSGAESSPRRRSPNSRDKAAERRAAALKENHEGVVATRAQDWPTALIHFEKALKLNPDDKIIRQNLADAREAVALRKEIQKAEREAAETGRRNDAAVNNMRRSIERFGQTLDAASSAGGLDFDGGTTDNAPAGSNGGLDFTANDAMVVNAQKVPSGLSKPLDDAITAAYSNAPAGVSDRVRKGFQAVANRDWKVAKAWFEDALNHDPGNAGIKRFLAALDRPMPGRPPVAVASTSAPVSAQSRTPIYMVGRDGQPVELPDDYRGNVQTYLMGQDGKWVSLPIPSDIAFMFPGLAPPPVVPTPPVPIYRIDAAGKHVEVPADYNGSEAIHITGKNGRPVQIPAPSDVQFLFPSIAPATAR
jgi:tetratricopeptide (TPR) repeat protein